MGIGILFTRFAFFVASLSFSVYGQVHQGHPPAPRSLEIHSAPGRSVSPRPGLPPHPVGLSDPPLSASIHQAAPSPSRSMQQGQWALRDRGYESYRSLVKNHLSGEPRAPHSQTFTGPPPQSRHSMLKGIHQNNFLANNYWIMAPVPAPPLDIPSTYVPPVFPLLFSNHYVPLQIKYGGGGGAHGTPGRPRRTVNQSVIFHRKTASFGDSGAMTKLPERIRPKISPVIQPVSLLRPVPLLAPIYMGLPHEESREANDSRLTPTNELSERMKKQIDELPASFHQNYLLGLGSLRAALNRLLSTYVRFEDLGITEFEVVDEGFFLMGIAKDHAFMATLDLDHPTATSVELTDRL
jgi:hypothetical protein